MRIPYMLKMNLFVGAVLLICFAFVASAFAENRGSQVKVMTRNICAGTDFDLLASAANEAEFEQFLSQTIDEILQSNIPGRAVRLAAEIAKSKPDVIALQEVTTWKFGSGSETVEMDQLELLMEALRAAGQRYRVAAIQTLTYIEIPDAVAFTDHNAILVRAGEVNVLSAESHIFETNMFFPTPSGDIPILSGWMTADIKIRDSRFKFVNTHLAAAIAEIPDTKLLQLGQAAELMEAISESNLPVILAGDFNSDAEQTGAYPADMTDSYLYIASAGFEDAWHALHPKDLGLTWPLGGQSPLLERIDLIFSDKLIPDSVIRTGLFPYEDGLYVSDHAGVVAVYDLMKYHPCHHGGIGRHQGWRSAGRAAFGRLANLYKHLRMPGFLRR
jgi:endonuclease/exonuclease/phosphatase family metal-dependent hydrolase